MPMKEIFHPNRSRPGRDVNQVKPMPQTFQFQTHRPVRLVVLVPPHNLKYRPDA